MTTYEFDVLARRAATGISRRGSLMALGGAGLVSLADSLQPASGKKNKGRKKATKKCKKQETQCNDFFAPLCEDEEAPEDCRQATLACCDALRECHATDFLDCLWELLRPQPE